MRKSILALTLIITSAIYADEEVIQKPVYNPYIKMGAHSLYTKDFFTKEWKYVMSPSLQVGVKRIDENFAVDLSFEYSDKANGWTNPFGFSSIMFPKINGLYYPIEFETAALFIGGGIAWGQQAVEYSYFSGLFTNITTGIDFNRFGSVNSSLQIDVVIPTLAQDKVCTTYPSLAVKLGFGF